MMRELSLAQRTQFMNVLECFVYTMDVLSLANYEEDYTDTLWTADELLYRMGSLDEVVPKEIDYWTSALPDS